MLSSLPGLIWLPRTSPSDESLGYSLSPSGLKPRPFHWQQRRTDFLILIQVPGRKSRFWFLSLAPGFSRGWGKSTGPAVSTAFVSRTDRLLGQTVETVRPSITRFHPAKAGC